MKKALVVILTIICILPCVAFAESVDRIRISAVFTGTQGAANAEKVYVKYRTVSYGVVTNGEIYLSSSNNFTAVVSTTPIDGILFSYAIAITRDGKPDAYGFMKFTGNTQMNYESGVAELTVVGTLDTKNFDGQKYRANSDLTNDDLDKFKSGKSGDVVLDGESVPVITNPNIINKNGTIIYNGNEGNTTNNDNKSEREIKEEKKKEQDEQRKEETKKSFNLLIIIVSVIVGLLLLFVIITFVKMVRVNNRV